MFDLNSAIKNWRDALKAQPSFRGSDLDELEDHLREETTALQGGGLSEEEAFLVACRRLGKPEDLNGEFAIADPARRRSFRLSWMITGALALIFLWLASAVLSNFGAGMLGRIPGESMFLRGPIGLGWMAGSIRLISLVLGCLLIWRLLATDRSSHRLRKMRGRTIIGISLLLAFLALAARTGSQMLFFGGLTHDGTMEVAVVSSYINMFMLLVLPVLLLVGLWRVIRS